MNKDVFEGKLEQIKAFAKKWGKLTNDDHDKIQLQVLNKEYCL
jgi:uncharacterized protein YjbJ (UPF0337 family)